MTWQKKSVKRIFETKNALYTVSRSVLTITLSYYYLTINTITLYLPKRISK